MAPRVSVVVPTFDRWPMVREAVDSVLGQTYRDFELIVVDDGSRDGTARRLAAHAPGIQVLRQARSGVAAARNHGARRSSGRYLAFLDSDDLWHPRKLEIQTAFMEANPAVRICQTEEIWIRRQVRVNANKRHRKLSGDIFRASLDLCLVSPSAVMMTRELFEWAGGFDEAFPVCEDYDLWLRIARAHPVELVATPLVTKRGGHQDQLSRSIWGLDRFRVASLVNILHSGIEGERKEWVIEALKVKSAVLARGARKRGRDAEASAYEALAAAFTGDKSHDGRKDLAVRDGEGISRADAGAVARPG